MTATPPPVVPSHPVLTAPDGSQVRVVAVPVGKSPLGELLQSKKFLAMIAGMVFTALSNAGLDIAPATQEQVMNLVMVYIGAQGVADAGQGFARARQTLPPPATPA